MSARIVDAHVHLWDRAAHPLSWFSDDLGLAPAVTPAALFDAAPVDAAIAVQAADSLVEAEWLRDQARQERRLRRVVLQYTAARGEWAGIVAPALGRDVAGIRAAVPQAAADLSDVEGLDALGDGLARTDRVLEFLVRPAQLPAVSAFAGRHPRLAVVICHLGLGGSAPTDAWRADLAESARRGNVHAKVSGVLAGRTPGELALIGDVALEAFGPGRLMFGSDWPMSARSLPYADVVGRTSAMITGLSPAETAAVWHRTAERVYAL
ncbi:amidohydrolase family protein [Microbacterium sp. NPDC055903]